MTTPDLPPRLVEQVERLSSQGWRERKEAVGRLRDEVGRGRLPRPVLEALSERLLDGLLATDAVQGRAACHEVLTHLGEVCIPPLLRHLQLGGPGTRLLVDLLGEIGDESHVALLVSTLDDTEADQNLRASAASALGRIGGDAAVQALVGLLAEDSDMLQTYALDALRAAKARVDVSLVEPLLTRPFTRKGAAAVLGHTGDVAALPTLVGLVDDPMAGVRAVAVCALVQLEQGLADKGKQGLIGAAISRVDEATRRQVRALVHHRDRTVRVAAIRLAALAGDAEALPAVLDVMDDPMIQEAALTMVAELGERSNDALVHAAEHAGAAQLENLFRLIGALPSVAVAPALLGRLMEALDDVGEDTSSAAAEALRVVGDRTSLGGLYRAMGDDGPLGEAAADAMAAILERIGKSRHDDLSLIVGANWPQEGALARNLCRVVGKLGASDYVPHLVSMLGSTDVGVRVAAAQALGGVRGEHEGVGALTFALTDEEPQVRAAASRSLGQLGAQHGVPSLLSATADPSPLVRAAAVQALVVLDNPVALARFREIIAEDPVPTVVVQAIAGLGSSGLDQDLTMLMSLCTSTDHEVVKAAARALVGFAAHRATAALLGLLDHERWDVRWAAAEVLARRGDQTAVDPLRRVLERERDRLVRQVIEEALAALSQNQGSAG